jgi:ribosome-binding protein aMBF1 (putative translation factor)
VEEREWFESILDLTAPRRKVPGMKSQDPRSSKAHWPKLYEEFRRALVRAREEAGLTQRDAARLLGRTQSFVAKSETGERRVDIVEAALFANAYKKPLDFFLPRAS